MGVTAADINAYLASKGSPLAGQGQGIIDVGRAYDLDPRLLVALSGAETGFGKNVTAGANNVVNVLYSGKHSPFESYASAFKAAAKSITNPRNNYNLADTTHLYSRYCHGPCGKGLQNLNTFMVEQGAATNSLHFPADGAAR